MVSNADGERSTAIAAPPATPPPSSQRESVFIRILNNVNPKQSANKGNEVEWCLEPMELVAFRFVTNALSTGIYYLGQRNQTLTGKSRALTSEPVGLANHVYLIRCPARHSCQPWSTEEWKTGENVMTTVTCTAHFHYFS